jgi:23S rRNA (guanosine2251-2'-O)-methyltransferase
VSERELVVGGLHATRSALARAPADALELWLLADGAAAREELAAQARQLGVAVHHAAARTLDRLYGDPHHQGVVLRRRAPAPCTLERLLGAPAADGAPLVLVLDCIQDPRNFGACLRAADGAGVDAVIYPRDRSARLTSVVAKAASGAVDSVPLVPVPNLATALSRLRDAGVWVTGAAADAELELYALDLTRPTALVLGNEGGGLRRLTRANCDQLMRIPMHGALPSLNVATAAAVCLFEARRQRRGPR